MREKYSKYNIINSSGYKSPDQILADFYLLDRNEKVVTHLI